MSIPGLVALLYLHPSFDFDLCLQIDSYHHWQAYRTRKDRSLPTVTDQGYVYDKKGKHVACVKVVDVFGADTSITVEVEV